MAIDYGTRRVGIAVTDPDQMIATPLTTINTAALFAFLKTYMQHEVVDTLVVGLPKRLHNVPSPMAAIVQKCIKALQRTFPDKQVVAQDERYTSKIAADSLIAGGFKKKDRYNKANLDKLSATIMLQSFLATHRTETRS